MNTSFNLNSLLIAEKFNDKNLIFTNLVNNKYYYVMRDLKKIR